MNASDPIEISDLINSERYQKVLEEIGSLMDQAVQEHPYSEPLLCSSIGDNEALQLLEKENQHNQDQFNDLYQIYQEIIEHTLYSQLELIPLEKQRDEMWKSLNSSTFAKLLDKYNILKREEATFIAKLRDELAKGNSESSLQSSCYSIQEQNQKLKKETKALESQLKRYRVDVEAEKGKTVDEIPDDDPELVAGRQIEERINEINSLIEQENQQSLELTDECESLKNEIESMTEQLVSMDNRSVASSRSKGKKRKL